jgi:hypothetical protein
VPEVVTLSAETPSHAIGDTRIQVKLADNSAAVCARQYVTVVGLDISLDSTNDIEINEEDEVAEEQPPGLIFWSNPNGRTETIDDLKDLENFTTLVIHATPSPAGSRTDPTFKLPEGFAYDLELLGISGNPAIRLFRKMGNGLEYLNDVDKGTAQVSEPPIEVLRSGERVALQSQFFDRNSNTAAFLFEGLSEGDAILRATLRDPEGHAVLQDEARLRLVTLRSLYTVADVRARPRTGPPPDEVTWPAPGFGNDASLAKDVVTVFVHGFNVSEVDAGHTFDTVFRRLYWTSVANPAGPSDFIGLTWEGKESTLPPPLSTQYNRNVFNAFEASAPVSAFFRGALRRVRQVNVVAHSLGNLLVSNAIKLDNGPGPAVDNYILVQAAVSANAYGSEAQASEHRQHLHDWLVRQAEAWGYPDDQRWFPERRWSKYLHGDPWGGYLADVPGKVVRMVNTWSEDDCVLGFGRGPIHAWWRNQENSRPDCVIDLPDGPNLCPELRLPGFTSSWCHLPEGPACESTDIRRQWAELAYYFADLAAPAGVREIPAPGVENKHVVDLGISGDCASDPIGGVHSYFAERPLHRVWGFWELVSGDLKRGSR